MGRGDTEANHPVEANLRLSAPLDAGGQFATPHCARPAVPAEVARLLRSITEQGQMEGRLQSQRASSTQAPGAVGGGALPSEPTSASFVSPRWRRRIVHRRGAKIAEGPGHGAARLGPRLRGGVRVPGGGGDWGWVKTPKRTLGSNHAVASPGSLAINDWIVFLERPRLRSGFSRMTGSASLLA